MTSLLVSGEESPVKCGAVLSPITDFELYGKFVCLQSIFHMEKVTVSAVCGKLVQYLYIIAQAQAVLSESI